MAKRDSEILYWLKFQDDFRRSRHILGMQKLPDGYAICWHYLSLLSSTLSDNGEILVGGTIKTIQEAISVQINVPEKLADFIYQTLVAENLIHTGDGVIYKLTEFDELVSGTSRGALRKQIARKTAKKSDFRSFYGRPLFNYREGYSMLESNEMLHLENEGENNTNRGGQMSLRGWTNVPEGRGGQMSPVEGQMSPTFITDKSRPDNIPLFYGDKCPHNNNYNYSDDDDDIYIEQKNSNIKNRFSTEKGEKFSTSYFDEKLFEELKNQNDFNKRLVSSFNKAGLSKLDILKLLQSIIASFGENWYMVIDTYAINKQIEINEYKQRTGDLIDYVSYFVRGLEMQLQNDMVAQNVEKINDTDMLLNYIHEQEKIINRLHYKEKLSEDDKELIKLIRINIARANIKLEGLS